MGFAYAKKASEAAPATAPSGWVFPDYPATTSPPGFPIVLDDGFSFYITASTDISIGSNIIVSGTVYDVGVQSLFVQITGAIDSTAVKVKEDLTDDWADELNIPIDTVEGAKRVFNKNIYFKVTGEGGETLVVTGEVLDVSTTTTDTGDVDISTDSNTYILLETGDAMMIEDPLPQITGLGDGLIIIDG